MEWAVGRATPADAGAIRMLRLEMLATCPDEFVTDAEYWRSRDDAFWAEFAHRAATADDEAVMLARASDQPVAMAHAKISDSIAEFGMLYVTEEARSYGIGAALVAARTVWAAEHGATHAQCSIVIGNAASESLHEAAGWIASDGVHLERAATEASPAVHERRWYTTLTD